jgi:hypothetical protein
MDLFRFSLPVPALFMAIDHYLGGLSGDDADALIGLLGRDDAFAFSANGRDVAIHPGPALVNFIAARLPAQVAA